MTTSAFAAAGVFVCIESRVHGCLLLLQGLSRVSAAGAAPAAAASAGIVAVGGPLAPLQLVVSSIFLQKQRLGGFAAGVSSVHWISLHLLRF